MIYRGKEVVLAVLASVGGEIVAVPRMRHAEVRWKLYYRNRNGKTTLLAKSKLLRPPARDSRFGGYYESADDAAETFGRDLHACPLNYYYGYDYYSSVGDKDCPAFVVNEVARAAYRKELWAEAESAEEQRLYYHSKRGVCATTHQDGVYVWRNDDGSETLVKKNVRGDYGKNLPVTENKSYLPLYGPDCIAIADDGREVVCETLKQIATFASTGEAVESGRQREAREWKEGCDAKEESESESGVDRHV